jgi:multiple sugar transport system permease protein
MAVSLKNLFLQAIGTHEGGRLTAHQRRFAVLGLIPILIWVFVFVLFPIFWVGLMSLFSYTPIREGGWFLGLGGNNPFVGLGNYIELFTGMTKSARIFRQSIGNTFLFSLLAVPLSVFTALPMAVVLESVHQRVKSFFRFVYFLPVITGSVAVTIIWQYVYAPNWGLLSQLFKFLGLTPPRSWLSDPHPGLFWHSAGDDRRHRCLCLGNVRLQHAAVHRRFTGRSDHFPRGGAH